MRNNIIQYNLNAVSLQIRLLFLTVLLAVAGFALVSHYSDNSSYAEDTTRVRFVSGQDNGDPDPIIENQHAFDVLIASLLLVLANVFVVTFVRSKIDVPRLIFLHHVRPRSPPFP